MELSVEWYEIVFTLPSFFTAWFVVRSLLFSIHSKRVQLKLRRKDELLRIVADNQLYLNAFIAIFCLLNLLIGVTSFFHPPPHPGPLELLEVLFISMLTGESLILLPIQVALYFDCKKFSRIVESK